MALDWHETAPGLLYEAEGDSGRRYVASFDGQIWMLDLFLDTEYEAEQQVEPQSAPTLGEAQRLAQDWEVELY